MNRGDSVITERDVVKARAAAQTQAAACDDVVLHSAPGGIRVDGYLCRRSPVGMRGALVQAETRVVTAGEEAVERLRQAARMAGVEIDEVLSSVVAAGRAAVQRPEAEAGVVHMDIGAGTTDAAAYFNNALLHTGSAPVGGDHLSNDIAMALNTSFSVGEGVLHDHGAASLEGAALKEEVTIPCYGVRRLPPFPPELSIGSHTAPCDGAVAAWLGGGGGRAAPETPRGPGAHWWSRRASQHR